jgi:RHS repeat-associated protein
LKDQFYNVRDLVDSVSTHYNHYDYDSFGVIFSLWSNGSGLTHAYGFQSRERDPETSLNYHRNRYYDALIGRWRSEDPIGFEGGDVNLNRFVRNAPTIRLDPAGLAEYDATSINIFSNGLVLGGQMHFGDTIINTSESGTTRVRSENIELLSNKDQDYFTARCVLRAIGTPLPMRSENGVYWAIFKNGGLEGTTTGWTGLAGDNIHFSFINTKYQFSALSPTTPGAHFEEFLVTLYHEVKGHNVDNVWHDNPNFDALYEAPVYKAIAKTKKDGTWNAIYCRCHADAKDRIKNPPIPGAGPHMHP